jgi:hypothetical protein
MMCVPTVEPEVNNPSLTVLCPNCTDPFDIDNSHRSERYIITSLENCYRTSEFNLHLEMNYDHEKSVKEYYEDNPFIWNIINIGEPSPKLEVKPMFIYDKEEEEEKPEPFYESIKADSYVYKKLNNAQKKEWKFTHWDFGDLYIGRWPKKKIEEYTNLLGEYSWRAREVGRWCTKEKYEAYKKQNDKVKRKLAVINSFVVRRNLVNEQLSIYWENDLDHFRSWLPHVIRQDIIWKKPIESTSDPPIPIIMWNLQVDEEVYGRICRAVERITKERRRRGLYFALCIAQSKLELTRSPSYYITYSDRIQIVHHDRTNKFNKKLTIKERKEAAKWNEEAARRKRIGKEAYKQELINSFEPTRWERSIESRYGRKCARRIRFEREIDDYLERKGMGPNDFIYLNLHTERWSGDKPYAFGIDYTFEYRSDLRNEHCNEAERTITQLLFKAEYITAIWQILILLIDGPTQRVLAMPIKGAYDQDSFGNMFKMNNLRGWLAASFFSLVEIIRGLLLHLFLSPPITS